MGGGFSKRILISITGKTDKHWQDQLKEIEKYKIRKIALFLEQFKTTQRKKIYKKLLKSNIKNIPLVHIRHDMTKDELIFLEKNFKAKCFTIHETSFRYLPKWEGFHKKLYLEMNFDNRIPKNVKFGKIGGFCVDLAHFKAAEERWSKEFLFVMKRRKISKYFKCNHLNGYSFKKNTDIHKIKSLKDFDYLKTLPEFLFGKYIGLETENSIKEQLKFKEYLIKMLNSSF